MGLLHKSRIMLTTVVRELGASITPIKFHLPVHIIRLARLNELKGKMPQLNPSLEIKLISLFFATILVFGISKLVYPDATLRSLDVGTAERAIVGGPESVDDNSVISTKSLAGISGLPDNEVLTYRLPKDVRPIKYFLRLQPMIPPNVANATVHDFDNGNYTLLSVPGHVNVSFIVAGPTNRIVMHISNISIESQDVKVFQLKDSVDPKKSLVEDDFETEIEVVDYEFDVVQDFYSVILEDGLIPGKKYLVSVPFTSFLSTQHTHGIFAAYYQDGAEKRIMVGTKFQATHARSAFPCWDEPDFKAEFEITIGRPSPYHSLSNAPLRFTTENTEMPGWYWDHFEPTLKMSVYLVCLAVSEYVSVEAAESLRNGRNIRVWARQELIDKDGGIYAANLTAEAIGFFEEYFNMTDSVSKVDSILIPNFRASAMENWGLVTYKESMLIYIPGENTEHRRKLVTTVVFHELAHHWFGNLITCRWWSDLWINEGFATYLSYLALENLYPEFDPDKEFIDEVYQLSLASDHYSSVWPMKNSARTIEEIEGAFSRVSYRKGASIIRMIASFLGKETLRQGLQNLLRKYAYDTVVQDDLFEELQAVGGSQLPENITVKEILDTWTLKSGFPLIRVETLNDSTVKLTQQSFADAVTQKTTYENQTWWVPITMATVAGNVSHTWMPSNQTSLILENVDATNWLLVNFNLSGYFVTIYDDRLTTLLQQQLETNHLVFNTVTRNQLISDYFQALHGGYIPLETALGFTKYLGKESEYIPWNGALPFFSELARRLRASKKRHDALRKYLVPKLEQVLNLPHVGMVPNRNGTDVTTVLLLRADLLHLACQLESTLCYTEARKMLESWMANPNVNPIPPNMEGLLLCAFVKSGDVEAWEFVHKKSKEPQKTENNQWNYLRALGCAENDDVIQNVLQVFNESLLHNDVLSSLARNKYAMHSVLDYILTNFRTDLNGTAGIGTEIFSEVMSTLGNYLYKDEDIQRVQQFWSENQIHFASLGKYVKQAIDTMQDNQAWMHSYGNLYTHWFEENA